MFKHPEQIAYEVKIKLDSYQQEAAVARSLRLSEENGMLKTLRSFGALFLQFTRSVFSAGARRLELKRR